MNLTGLLDEATLQSIEQQDLKTLAKLDKHGLLIAPGESAQAFAARLRKLAQALKQLQSDVKKHRNFEAAPGIYLAEKNTIDQSIINEALAVNEKLYDVRPDWVPGYFANESFGFFWGGCSLSDPDSGMALFIIRKSFKQKRKWLFYNRQELLSHELTHAAHQAFDQWQFEEYFAYRTAHSPLRKYLGGCFIHKFDAWGFLLPILLLPVVQFLNISGLIQLPVKYFWISAGIYPLFLVCRTMFINHMAQRARNYLKSLKIKNVDAILFRMSASEIKTLAHRQMPQGNDLRWELLAQRLQDKEN